MCVGVIGGALNFLGAIPLVGQESWHSLGAGTENRATATSGVKVPLAPEGLDLDTSTRRGRRLEKGWKKLAGLIGR